MDLNVITKLATNDPWRTVRNPRINGEVTFVRTASEMGGAYAGDRATLALAGATTATSTSISPRSSSRSREP